jgi:D-alanyl-D-alanine carboxypeptidase
MTVERTPDPENLRQNERPAVVDVTEQGQVYVATAKVQDSGWLWLKYWDGGQAKIPPRRVRAVQYLDTEVYGEPDSSGFKQKRVTDEDWRRRAKGMRHETADADGAAEAVVGDD